MTFRAEIHCHTNCSDGTASPLELIELAKEANLQGLSITDHDTILAYEEAIPAAKKAGIRLGSGAEFSCNFQDISIHVLAYDFKLNSPDIILLCQNHEERRMKRNRLILQKLRDKGFSISEDELLEFAKGRSVGRPHIAEVMLKKGYVKTLKEAFQKYIGDGRSCFAPGETVSLEETLKVIHESEGKAFLAHPHLLPARTPFASMLKLPWDGIECYYSRLADDACQKWVDIATNRNLLISGGSDFHGRMKPDAVLGCRAIGLETFDRIFTHEL
jgi:hypothetical protein